MPVTSSAIKKARQDKKARAHNRVLRDAHKRAAKKVRLLAEAGETKKADQALKEAHSKIDKAAKKNIIHKNNAARRKSKLAELVAEKAKEKKKKK